MSGPARGGQVVVLALDGVSPVLLRQWMTDGTLRNLARLQARAAWGATRNLDGFYVGSTWPSFYTSSSPARHGFHYQLQIDPGTYSLREVVRGRLVQTRPFWEIASDAGRRVAILDVPLAQPSARLNGIQVVEWGSHDAVNGFATVPASLGGEILRDYGPHPSGPDCDAQRSEVAHYARFRDALVAGVARKQRMTLDFLRREHWDLFVQVFTEGHCAGHQCWHLHDERHPAFDRTIADVAGDVMRDVYVAMDAAIGEIVAAVPDATVFLLDLHGMAHWFGAEFLLRDILVRLGVAALPPAEPETLASRVRAAARWRMAAAARRMPEAVRGPMTRLFQRRQSTATSAASELPPLPVDPLRSLCFPFKNGMAATGIRLNLAGREPAGLIAPGAGEDEFIRTLTRDLLDIVDDRSGGPLVRRVLRTRELYSGPQLDSLPDLLVEWSDDVATGSTSLAGGAGSTVRVHSQKIGVLEGRNRYGRTGEHRPDGMFMAFGPGVPRGPLPQPVSILDFAPTICSLLGVPFPDAEGQPIAQLLADEAR